MYINIIKEKIIYFPLLSLFAGMIWLPQASKPFVGIVIFSVIFSMVFMRGAYIEYIKSNIQGNTWMFIVFMSAVYSVFCYIKFGSSSQELRALITSLVFLIFFNTNKLKLSDIQNLTFIAGASVFFLLMYSFLWVDNLRLGLTSNPIVLAMHFGFLAIILMVMSTMEYEGKKLGFIIATMLILFSGMILTQSRGPVVVALLIFTLFYIRFVKIIKFDYKLLILFFLFMLTVFFLRDVITSRYHETNYEISRIYSGDLDSSIGLRIQMYTTGLKLFMTSPIFGVGDITYDKVNLINLTQDGLTFVLNSHLHNNYVDKLARGGLVGLLFFLSLLLYPILFAYKNKFKNKGLILFPCLFFLLCSLFDSPFRNGDILVFYLISISLFLKSELYS
ncbi:O-antigen ligase family protein [Vibrio metschnikovii]|uniref:O-antigen ligase family protein n=1 Tax=Vibrio metschnikovii TaxID=28172 RepID=UPI0029FABAA3|nr:O-antigen ligase family protein [Vibrio metschnikovii]EKO3697866.1 O-antigen ligase family protein [Vibrio metschnikovii]EKO3717686.1 O-antigen ligase family protein [Vibrio metschnikovii]EKO3721536.1 O-antigen ligase family protein [Vibrio metschnikovii]EKO3724428.1 O-antigen ligase family protein [Vibrio metschnikovii]